MKGVVCVRKKEDRIELSREDDNKMELIIRDDERGKVNARVLKKIFIAMKIHVKYLRFSLFTLFVLSYFSLIVSATYILYWSY